VKERRKPDRRWQSREIGGGLPQTSRVARASRFGSTCRGKALRIVKIVLLDEGAVAAVLVPRKCPGLTLRKAVGRDRERQRSDVSLVRGRKRQAEVAPPEGGARICHSPKGEQRRVRSAKAGGAPSSARPAGVGLSQDGPASHGRTGTLRKKGKGKHPAVSAAQATRPEVERSTGARVESRLQRSERGIFSAPIEGSREANRGCTG